MSSPVTWFEISSANSAKLHDFYARIFGWTLQPVDGDEYAIVDTDAGGAGIAGGIGEANGPNQVTFYVEVADPDAVLERIEAAGGRTVVPVTEIPDLVTFAQFADPEGNIVGLTKAR